MELSGGPSRSVSVGALTKDFPAEEAGDELAEQIAALEEEARAARRLMEGIDAGGAADLHAYATELEAGARELREQLELQRQAKNAPSQAPSADVPVTGRR
jgi:hypothetical protein